ncbi:hypothetical protein HOD38_00020 [archaeon]|jgi:membrane protein YqaA with SNARE-associated domain|nr:hypothetical protein [archaeon]MBT4396633.1 hypothetical protein [archaeon]MBT4441243.1 hypothetical protein [archaeon]
MKIHFKKPKLSVIFGVVGFLLVVILFSSTIGRSWFYGQHPSLLYLYILNFAGYLFFLVMPVEALVPYYMSLGYNGFLIGVIVMVTAILAQMVDYSIGYLLPDRAIENMIGTRKYEKFTNLVEKYGSYVIFLFNLFPISSPIVVLIAGMEKVDFMKTMKLCFFGLFVKYTFWILGTYWVLGLF